MAGGTASSAEHHALGQQLADDASAAGAEREADGDLAAALRRAREQQVRDVGARDEQDEDRRRLPQRQDRPRALVEHALRQRVDADAVIAVRVGKLLRETDGDHVICAAPDRACDLASSGR